MHLRFSVLTVSLFVCLLHLLMETFANTSLVVIECSLLPDIWDDMGGQVLFEEIEVFIVLCRDVLLNAED